MFEKAFFKDRLILLMGLIAGLLTTCSILLALWRIDTSKTATILRYWTVQGVPEFEKQTPLQLYSFPAMAIIVAVLGLAISYKLYSIHKPAAYVVLFLSQVALLTNLLASNAILNLQQ